MDLKAFNTLKRELQIEEFEFIQGMMEAEYEVGVPEREKTGMNYEEMREQFRMIADTCAYILHCKDLPELINHLKTDSSIPFEDDIQLIDKIMNRYKELLSK